jgi:hypothetical protein
MRSFAIKSVQAMISALGKIKLSLDGDFGAKTIRALLNLGEPQRQLVQNHASKLDVSTPHVLSASQADILATTASMKTGVPKSYFEKVIKLENKTVQGNVIVEFDGTFKGIGQFNRPTFEAVSTSPWSQVKDHSTSLEAVGQLYLANKKSFQVNRTADFEYTDEIAYLFHNQGAGAASSFLDSGKLKYPKQSRKALAVFDLAQVYYNDQRPKGGAFTRTV